MNRLLEILDGAFEVRSVEQLGERHVLAYFHDGKRLLIEVADEA